MTLSWLATYLDGSTIRESYDAYARLDRRNLCKFSIIDEDSNTVVSIEPLEGEVLFYRMRTRQKNSPFERKLIVFGCRKRNSSGEIQQRIIIVKNGQVFEDTQFRNDWYEPDWNVYPQERV